MSAAEIAEQLAMEFGRDGSRDALRRYDEKLKTLGRKAAGPLHGGRNKAVPALINARPKGVQPIVANAVQFLEGCCGASLARAIAACGFLTLH